MNPQRSWGDKFADAFRGLLLGVRGQNSFLVHFGAAAGVVAAGFLLGVTRNQWCLLLLCITLVIAAELFNSALESLAKAVDTEDNPQLARALDISSAAVLITAAGSSLVGAVVFLFP